MPPSEAVINKVKAWSEAFIQAVETMDYDKMLAIYHPDAVIVELGKKAIYGREAIEAHFKQSLTRCKATYKTIKEEYYGDDDYPIVKGTMTMSGEGGCCFVTFHYTMFARKEGDKYLVVHDEYEALESQECK